MTQAQITTMIAQAIVGAWNTSKDELHNQINNPNIVQHPEMDNRRWIELENHFFNVVVEYRPKLSERSYLSLCNKVEVLAGQRFSYRP